jgi:predicted ester cyclase
MRRIIRGPSIPEPPEDVVPVAADSELALGRCSPYAFVETTRTSTKGGREMERDQMLRLFEAHREAEAARDIDGILNTFVPNPFLATMALGLRSEGRDAVRAAYEMQFFSAFPDLAPADEGMAVGDDTVVVWGTLRGTSRGDWLGVPAGGGTFAVPFANVVPFRDGLMAGEIIYFDLATLCEQAGIPLEAVRAAAAARRS